MTEIYVICIGIPRSDRFYIVAYANTKKKAVDYLKALGYTHLSKWGYYQHRPSKHIDDGRWARIYPITEAEIGDAVFNMYKDDATK